MNVLMTLLLSAVAAAQTPAAPAPRAGDVDGKKIFAAKCATCHGKDAKGSPAMAKMFNVKLDTMDLTGEGLKTKKDKELVSLISKGKGKMPAFAGKLKDSEISSIVSYVRSLSAKR